MSNEADLEFQNTCRKLCKKGFIDISFPHMVTKFTLTGYSGGVMKIRADFDNGSNRQVEVPMTVYNSEKPK